MIQERYCSYEVSKLLEEKGFDGDGGDCECHMFYCKYCGERIMPICEIGLVPDNEKPFFAPTHQMALDYLRKKHNILIWFSPVIPTPVPKDETVFYWEWNLKKKSHSYPRINSHIKYKTLEEAVEAALKYCLTELI